MLSAFMPQIEQLVRASRRAALDYQLMQCSSGNFSYRADRDHVLITASRTWMADIRADQIAICRLSDGIVLNGLTPSVESRFHLGILQARPEIQAVLHFQSPHATTLACGSPEDINYFMVPEIPYYIGEIGMVPYITPGSPELADAVVKTMLTHNLAVLHSHGMVTAARSLDLAIQNAVFFELACRIIVEGGERVKPLTAEAAVALKTASRV